MGRSRRFRYEPNCFAEPRSPGFTKSKRDQRSPARFSTGRSGEREPPPGPELLHRARLSGAGVLDRLRLVEHHEPERAGGEPGHAGHPGVGHHDQVDPANRLRREGPELAPGHRRGVNDEHAQRGGESLRLRLPVRQQRRRDHEEVGAGDGATSLQQEQEGEDLDRLAEPHVVGQAAPESQPGKRPEPAHALALVGPELREQRRARVGRLPAGLAAQGRQRLAEPGARLDPDPLRGRRRAGHPRLPPCRLRRGGASHRRRRDRPTRLRFAAFHRRSNSSSRSASTSTHRPLRRASPLPCCRSACSSASVTSWSPSVRRTSKSSTASSPRPAGWRSPTETVTRGRGAAGAAPPVGHPDDHTALLERRDLAEEPVRLGRRPGLRLEEPPGVRHRLDERAPLRRALDWLQEGQEPAPVGGGRGLADGVAERPVLRLAALGEPASCRWPGKRRAGRHRACSRRDGSGRDRPPPTPDRARPASPARFRAALSSPRATPRGRRSRARRGPRGSGTPTPA